VAWAIGLLWGERLIKSVAQRSLKSRNYRRGEVAITQLVAVHPQVGSRGNNRSHRWINDY
jgi:hypothetical protein